VNFAGHDRKHDGACKKGAETPTFTLFIISVRQSLVNQFLYILAKKTGENPPFFRYLYTFAKNV
jgi:hypothetical protein